MSKLDLRKQYLKLAYEQLNPSSNDFSALEQVLVNWFCLKFNTTPNDPRLLNFRLDELMLFRMMNEIHERPGVLQEIQTDDEYEQWLKHEMGDQYQSMKDMAEGITTENKLDEEVAKSLPSRIETDFRKVQGK